MKTAKKYEINFKILNEYNKYLYVILKNINLKGYTWKIETEEIFLKDGSWLFNEIEYNYEIFNRLISNTDYYIVFAQLKAITSNSDSYIY